MENSPRPAKPKLLDQVRNELRLRHMSQRTEKAYLRWIVEFLTYHRTADATWRHPNELASPEINEFLSMLAVKRKVAASTQNQALSAILFLYTKVLKSEIQLDAVRAKQPQRLSVVLSLDEVRRLLCAIPEGQVQVIAGLMYGAGLRVMEACPQTQFLNGIRSPHSLPAVLAAVRTYSVPVGDTARRSSRSTRRYPCGGPDDGPVDRRLPDGRLLACTL